MNKYVDMARKSLRNYPLHDPYDQPANVCDMICGLMHFCAHEDIDFDDALRWARDHFHSEHTKPDDIELLRRIEDGEATVEEVQEQLESCEHYCGNREEEE